MNSLVSTVVYFVILFSQQAVAGDFYTYDYIEYLSEDDFLDNYDGSEFLNDPSLSAVTTEFGPTVLSTTQLPIRSEVVVSEKIPWSSWWYPKREDWMFEDASAGGKSVLSKYDLIRQIKYQKNPRGPRPGSAAEYERAHYNPQALSWEGLCDAWSIASIAHPEPKRPVTYVIDGKSFSFNIGELKALLLKTYEAVDDSHFKFYGQKFSGDNHGWIYPDIFPDQFHRFVEVILFQQRRPFIMDHDAGIQIWNTPVYKANYVIDRVPNDPNAIFVRTWIYTAEPTRTNDVNYHGTYEIVREYDYVLQGKRNSQGQLVIESGYWVKGPDGVDSRRSHPDYLIWVPPTSQIVRKSWNPEIDINLVDEILSKSY
ncbi:MAG: hypothetical protein BroJett040_23690 [Oligoflexia bacterium]|nr:MAG: hypothetical protein BroJett040_23690 [Oligoflexia bacterium]